VIFGPKGVEEVKAMANDGGHRNSKQRGETPKPKQWDQEF